ncbi:MAG: superoxide dismutase [Opitutales bacterium]|nr:superoxide dismutase [Opitutales bacterium]
MKKYEQKPLRYDMSALEPHMQKCTLEFHYGKHHAAYIANLNAALEKAPEFEAPECPARLVHHLHHVPEAIRTAVRNNGGGHFNHSFFWKCLTPNGQGAPVGELAKAIDRDFGSFDAFREKFEAAAMSHFGAGWAWLILKKDGKLAVCSTPNQDCPLMPESVVPGIEHGRPILALDLWEHSFYLQYQNRKADYIKSFWKLVDWEQAEKVYQKALAHRLAKAEGKKDGCCCSQEKQGCMI